MDIKDYITWGLTVISLVISGYTFWLVQFNRGKLRMTQPTYVCLKRDIDPTWPKLFLRTCLYSTGAKGLAIENLLARVHQNDSTYVFDYWGHTEDTGSKDLIIGSGLFVGPSGVSHNHHFNLRNSADEFLYAAGSYRIEIVATVVGRPSFTLMELAFEVDGQQSAELIQRPQAAQLDLYWDSEGRTYNGDVRLRT